MSAAKKVTLFVDVVSPFAYEAFHILRNDAAFRNVQVTYVPIFLGGLMKACGNTAPIQIKNKDKWVNRERVRWAQAFAIPMTAASPPDFPPNTVHVMRVLCQIASQDQLAQTLARLFHALWVEHRAVASADVFAPVLREVLGPAEAERVLAAATTTGKATLKENTDRAFAAGAFGLPWMECTNSAGATEGFWGVDHLGQVLQFLGLEKPSQGGWKSVL
ncbi:Uu.00g063040.m01.CDS01 [Anthostomella pinea]|uniref:Glutathione S-transferase kappa n=1 Tax=Anthostomella pinea TaxID=933095 RepID=A0AAI8VU24_9PEZI|nr:Uu.00g063040.m01.CDS01 [Anthostomella pinea]